MAEVAGSWDLKWELLVADTWDDEALKQRLLDDPATLLKERGISMPEGVSVNVVADDESTVNLVLPEKPDEYALSEEELESVAAGACGCSAKLCNGGGGGTVDTKRQAREKWIRDYRARRYAEGWRRGTGGDGHACR